MGWPGLGPLFLDAVMARDVAVVLAVVMLSATLLVLGNLLADLLLYCARSAHPGEMTALRPTRMILSLWLLGLLHAAVLLAGFVAPYPYAGQHREYPYAPPSRVHWWDTQGRFHARPFVYGVAPDPASGGYREDPAQLYPIRFLVRAGSREAGPLDFPRRLFGVDAPGVLFLLGSDSYGRDVFSRLLYGGQVSLLTGILAAALSLTLGLAIGTAAGSSAAGWTPS